MTGRLLVVAAVGDILTGLALVLVPSIVGHLLLGVPLVGIAMPVARVAGINLIGLGIACWPGPPRLGMLIYSALVALYLAYFGLIGGLGRRPPLARRCPAWCHGRIVGLDTDRAFRDWKCATNLTLRRYACRRLTETFHF